MGKINNSTSLIFALLVLTAFSANVYALSGNGTESDPWLIKSLADFEDFVADANYWDDYTRLDADINLTGITYSTAPISPDTINSSTFQGTAFTGAFDGNGHMILNLTIDAITGNDYLGLFGQTGSTAEIKNLGIEDCNIIGGTGSERAGTLVGFNYGTIKECYTTGTLVAGDRIGGLAGYNSGGVVSNCYAMVSVTGDDVVAGLIGTCFSSTVSYCYATGAVSGDLDVGGLMGTSSSDTVTACFWDTDIGGPDNGIGTGKTTAEMQTKSTFTDTGWDFIGETDNGTDNIWTIDENNNYPRYWQGILNGSGSEADPFVIESLADFNEFSSNDLYWGAGLYTRLETDINLSGTTYTTAVISADTSPDSDFQGMPFSGYFDGNRHMISNLQINVGAGNYYLGLFGYIDNEAEIKNLYIENCNITDGDAVGDIGCLAGANNGTVINCCASGSITSERPIWLVGGLIGYNVGNAAVIGCHAAVTVNTTATTLGGSDIGGLIGRNFSDNIISKCYSTGDVYGKQSVGGLIGGNMGYLVSDCYATGNASGIVSVGGLVGSNNIGDSEISNSYSTGAVSGSSNAKGLVGYNVGTVTNSFWDIETSGKLTSAGGTGKTTAEMRTASTFLDAGWDMVAVWNIEEDQIYPLLRKYLAVDTNYDGMVNMIDFAAFANHWLEGVE
ncbi:MAG: GLUG motif-containing protein [Phycisphaerae bacterium]|nr:GLUG motif-containing protein [Phycisphaerae bacterium]MDD5380497.1 GLUG motif-containing protein [Phycisphaerae bacterium]